MANTPKKKYPESQGQKNKQPNQYLRFSGIGFQTVAIIFLGVFFGMKLDEHFKTEKRYFTLGLTIFSIIAALYFMIRQVLKKD